jgi:hypothetical protein
MTTHVYVAPRASGFNFTVLLGKKKKGKETRFRVRFEKGQFKTDDDKLAKAIDALLATSVGIRRNCRKADEAAALKLALAHKAMMQSSGAHKGGVTSEAVKKSMTDALAVRDEELRDVPVDTQAFADDNLQFTEEAPEPAKTETPAEASVVEGIAIGLEAAVKPKGIILGGQK